MVSRSTRGTSSRACRILSHPSPPFDARAPHATKTRPGSSAGPVTPDPDSGPPVADVMTGHLRRAVVTGVDIDGRAVVVGRSRRVPPEGEPGTGDVEVGTRGVPRGPVPV